jgi:hypothetical protein
MTKRFEFLDARVLFATHILPNRYLSLSLFLISIVAYGFLAFNLILAGDDWMLIAEPDAMYDFNIRIGRWTNVVIWNLFFQNRFSPAFTLFACVSLLILSSLFLAHIVGARDPASVFMFSAALIFNPLLAEQLSFESNHLWFGFGVLFATIAAYISYRLVEKCLMGQSLKTIYPGILIACFFLALSIGTQQSMLLFYFTIAAGSTLFVLVEEGNNYPIRKSTTDSAKIYSIVGVAGLIIYFLITKVIQEYYSLFPPSEGDYAIAGSLVSSREDLLFTLRNRKVRRFA